MNAWAYQKGTWVNTRMMCFGHGCYFSILSSTWAIVILKSLWPYSAELSSMRHYLTFRISVHAWFLEGADTARNLLKISFTLPCLASFSSSIVGWWLLRNAFTKWPTCFYPWCFTHSSFGFTRIPTCLTMGTFSCRHNQHTSSSWSVKPASQNPENHFNHSLNLPWRSSWATSMAKESSLAF